MHHDVIPSTKIVADAVGTVFGTFVIVARFRSSKQLDEGIARHLGSDGAAKTFAYLG